MKKTEYIVVENICLFVKYIYRYYLLLNVLLRWSSISQIAKKVKLAAQIMDSAWS